LGDRSAVEPLTDFLRLYHADASDEYMVEALGNTAEALVTLSGPVAAPVLKEISEDTLGSAAVRERVNIALEMLEYQQAAAKHSEEAEQAAQQLKADTEVEEQIHITSKKPARLSTALLAKILLPVRDDLNKCVKKSEKQAFSARVLLIVESGDLKTISVTPKHLQNCIEPLIRSQKFPLTLKGGKERVTYTIQPR